MATLITVKKKSCQVVATARQFYVKVRNIEEINWVRIFLYMTFAIEFNLCPDLKESPMQFALFYLEHQILSLRICNM